MSVLLRESCDKIHRDLLEGEGAFFGCNAVKRYPFPMGHNLILLADGAAFDVVCDPLSHSSPRQDLRSFSDRLVSSGVTCGRMIVDEGHKVSFRKLRYLRSRSVYKEFRFEEGLILIVVVSMIGVGWT